MSEYGRLPLAQEVDKLDYLPSSRQIQKKFGGLVKLRGELGYQENRFGRGLFRSKIASRVNVRGRNAELMLQKILINMFGEVFVHTEKIFDNSKNRVDFYIYSPTGNFGIDVFYTETMRSLQSNINIKINKYRNFPARLFIVVANNSFNQKELDLYANSKIRPLSKKTKIITLDTLINLLKKKRVYRNPLKKFHSGQDMKK